VIEPETGLGDVLFRTVIEKSDEREGRHQGSGNNQGLNGDAFLAERVHGLTPRR
jgi:hypothetical protein